MNKPEAAVAAVLALNGRMVQGSLLAARLYRPGPEEKAASKSTADKEAAAAAIKQRRGKTQQRAEVKAATAAA